MPIPTRLANDGWWLCDAEISSVSARSPAHSKVGLFVMIISLASTSTIASSSRNIVSKLLLAVTMTALADWLFYGHTVGLSLAIFLACLIACSLMTSQLHIGWRRCCLALGIMYMGLAPVIEEAGALSISISLICTAIAAALLTNPLFQRPFDSLAAVGAYLVQGPFHMLPELANADRSKQQFGSLTIWIVPVLVGIMFVALFAAANPIIGAWIFAFDMKSRLSAISLTRLLFWSIAISLIWPFIYTKWLRRDSEASNVTFETEPLRTENAALISSKLFGPASILRSLIVFNALFAVETLLDGMYLWGGVSLPDGVTYASYAHQGAYPLILTAILAAGFILLATRPGMPVRHASTIRALVFLWIAQNILLVLSSMLRLDLYVATYSLTYWRVAAFVWMSLVAVGLILIVVRMILNRSNSWLFSANLAAAAVAIYVCAFINFPALIADYNVAHSREVSGKGIALDAAYLASLGPQVIPALDRYIRSHSSNNLSGTVRYRDNLAAKHNETLSSWRSWSFRGARLQRYLDHNSPGMMTPNP